MPSNAHVCPHCLGSLALIVSAGGELLCVKCGVTMMVANGVFVLAPLPARGGRDWRSPSPA